MLSDVLRRVKQTVPESVASVAVASKTMHEAVKLTGIIKKQGLMYQAENAWRGSAKATAVLEAIIAATADRTVPLSSKDCLEIIQCLPIQLATFESARGIVGLVEALNLEHQSRALNLARGLITRRFGDGNRELFDRLANIAVSLQSDEDKTMGMRLLPHIISLPEMERLTRFDRLASILGTIENEQEKAESICSISAGICALPSHEMNDQFTKYANVAHLIQDDSARANAMLGLSSCILSLPENDKRSAFDKLVAIARSIHDAAAIRQVGFILHGVAFSLPRNEQAAALASLAT